MAGDHLAGPAALRHHASPGTASPGDPARSAEEHLAYHSAFVTTRTPAIDTLTTSVRT
ncbi:hypothetical protein ACFU9B_44155 [Streptomyces sp. NPDC057592]|uniref:hypothetical protein n=1 Tax=unclassified Streptomyces TaxID=2593676 RepID=UPI0036940A98